MNSLLIVELKQISDCVSVMSKFVTLFFDESIRKYPCTNLGGLSYGCPFKFVELWAKWQTKFLQNTLDQTLWEICSIVVTIEIASVELGSTQSANLLEFLLNLIWSLWLVTPFIQQQIYRLWNAVHQWSVAFPRVFLIFVTTLSCLKVPYSLLLIRLLQVVARLQAMTWNSTVKLRL